MCAFQSKRGLRDDGVCGAQTWSALVEAGFQFGDRWLYYIHPMVRGDDVAALQRQLGGLGFASERVDGIFGPDTQAAVEEFQRNAGLTVDGICGPATMAALRRLGGHCRAAEPVVGVREEERRRQMTPGLTGCRVVIAHAGGLGAVARAASRALAREAARVTVVGHPDGAAQARAANGWAAEVFVSLDLGDAPGAATAYFRGTHWHSESGRMLAEELESQLVTTLDVPPRGVRGMAVPALRETRMPAVLCEIGPAQVVVEHSNRVGLALLAALSAWLET